MAVIDVGVTGTGVTKRMNALTYIAQGNPANDTGKITAVTFRILEDATGIIVAIFEKVNGDTFTARDQQALGDKVIGLHEDVAVDLDVVTGDYIGIYMATGRGAKCDENDEGYWFIAGDETECVDTEFSRTDTSSIDIYGEGATPGWTGKVSGVTDPAKVMGVDKANIAKVKGVS